MVQINFALREVSCKIVYYGPGLGGKTTTIQVIHDKAPTDRKGKLTSIATEGDRTLFFDFLPLELGTVGGMKTKFQLYTVPGQVYYNATRKLVLEGADGVVFVADSQQEKMRENIESWQNLQDNLREYGLDIHDIPVVIQYNKRDLPSISPVQELEAKVNTINAPSFESCAITGEGVLATLKALSAMVLERLNQKQARGAPGVRRKPMVEKPAPKVAAAPAPPRAPARAPEPVVAKAKAEPAKVAPGPAKAVAAAPKPGVRPRSTVAKRAAPKVAPPKQPVKAVRSTGARAGRAAPRVTVVGATEKKSKAPYIIATLVGALVIIGVIVLIKVLGG